MTQEQRLVQVVRTAPQYDKDWYVRLKKGLQDITTVYQDWTLQRLAELVALMSPQVYVKRAARRAYMWVTQRELDPSMPRPIVAQFTRWQVDGTIGGRKTQAFARAIVEPRSNVYPAVIDTWMFKGLGFPKGSHNNSRLYREASNRVQQIARLAGEPVHSAQAALWSYFIRAAGRTPRCLGNELREVFGLDGPDVDTSSRTGSCPF